MLDGRILGLDLGSSYGSGSLKALQNDNLPEIVELYGNNSRKITCDIYIDDRNMKLDEMI